jgi:Na+/H+-dicarboxylate symporter|tara:strand:+ start:10931 stop:12229 length:1299 start_codon:yes stop_codon:yes gene_type:complete
LKLALHWQILGAIALAVFIFGPLSGFGIDESVVGFSLLGAYEFIGTLFINALKMIIVPLIMSAIISGVAGMGSGEGVGRLGLKTVVYYVMTSFFAIMVGLILVNIIQPGVVDGQPAKDFLSLPPQTYADSITAKAEGKGMGDIAAIFIRMVPTNIVQAASDGQMLGIIFFSLLFGFFMLKTVERQRQTLVNFWDGLHHTMMHITLFIMKFAPIGVLGLVAKVVTETIQNESFSQAIGALFAFFITVLLALLAHMFIILPLVLKYLGKIDNPFRHHKAMFDAILTAFSTASSSATLPVTLECVQKNAKVSEKTSSFVLPLGATVNMDGTALYECVVVIFLLQAYGADLSFAVQLTVVITALLTSIGVAGIPSASLVAITVILSTVGLPAEAVGLVWVTDRLLDMCRTAVNVFSDSCGAVVIASSEGEEPLRDA